LLVSDTTDPSEVRTHQQRIAVVDFEAVMLATEREPTKHSEQLIKTQAKESYNAQVKLEDMEKSILALDPQSDDYIIAHSKLNQMRRSFITMLEQQKLKIQRLHEDKTAHRMLSCLAMINKIARQKGFDLVLNYKPLVSIVGDQKSINPMATVLMANDHIDLTQVMIDKIKITHYIDDTIQAH
jgi:hypothetical protein